MIRLLLNCDKMIRHCLHVTGTQSVFLAEQTLPAAKTCGFMVHGKVMAGTKPRVFRTALTPRPAAANVPQHSHSSFQI
jgi:hypothetical protein